MKINCLIIGDEPLAISVIESYIKEFNNIVIVNVYHSPVEALADIEGGTIDVIFLDINMPQMNGLEFLHNLKSYPLIIITTAYKEHAIESFELDVLDYLVKPIPFSRFLKSVNKLTNRLITERGISKVSDFNQEPHIFLKIEKKLVKIILKEILYIESLKDYIKLHTTTGNYIAHKSLSSIIDELPSENFIRVHKSYAIAIDKVKSVEGNLIEIGNKGIPMGRNYIYHAKERIFQKKTIIRDVENITIRPYHITQ